MKLKMAENSLFAVLLRSPWWASLSVALVLSLLSGAFMPEGYKLVGVLATAPFVIISALAAQRQWREPSAEQVEQRTLLRRRLGHGRRGRGCSALGMRAHSYGAPRPTGRSTRQVSFERRV